MILLVLEITENTLPMFTQILDDNFNNTIRKHVIGFGSLFNSIYVQSTRSSGTVKTRVPLSYGPKEKFIQKIISESGISDTTHIQMSLPRMGFEINNLQYDPMRRLNKLKEKRKIINETSQRAYSESPYNFNFLLYIFSRSSEHNLQIIEQIVPYFTPDFTVSINMNELYTKVDVPIVLTDVQVNEEYDGAFDNRRSIVSVLSFIMKGYIYSPTVITSSGIIETVDINFYEDGITSSNFITDIGYTGDSSIGITSATWSPEGQP